MSIQREIEIKKLINKDDFLKLKSFLNVAENQVRKQTNYYFDTPNYALSLVHHASLRVRESSGQHLMTLKIDDRTAEGKLEIEQAISPTDFKTMVATHQVPLGEVNDHLVRLLPHPLPLLYNYNSLTTYRLEITYYGGLLCLDENHYHGVVDFEVEYESSSMAYGKKVIATLFKLAKIESSYSAPSKIKRAFLQLEKNKRSTS